MQIIINFWIVKIYSIILLDEFPMQSPFNVFEGLEALSLGAFNTKKSRFAMDTLTQNLQ